MKQLVAGNVMEAASMAFHGDFKKRCLLTIMVSQILLLTLLISEIKNTQLLQTDFLLHKDLFFRSDMSSKPVKYWDASLYTAVPSRCLR